MSSMIDTVVAALKEQLATPKADVEKNIRALLNEMLIKMDVVTQQEMQRQTQALQLANARIQQLQMDVEQLTQQIHHQSTDKNAPN